MDVGNWQFTTTEITGLITSVGVLITAMSSWRNSRKIKENNVVVKQLEKQTNHMKDELVAEVRKLAFQNGKAIGHEEAKLEDEAFIRGRKEGVEEARKEMSADKESQP